MPTDALVFLLIAAALWTWWSAARSRETAIRLARSACRRCQVQLLDETVSLQKLRLKRDSSGRTGIERWYQFEFSTNGADRRAGIVGVRGATLTDMHLDLDIEEVRH